MSLQSPPPDTPRDPRRVARSLGGLPPPAPEAEAHSARVTEAIRAEMDAAGGTITFARFMALALYAPGLGYYSAGSRKFGEEGDFVTAPELSPLFSRCLGRQCAEVLTAVGGGDVLEFGAGSGIMATELLAELARLESMPGRYFILEVSADLRQRQAATLRQRVPELAGRVSWLDALPEPGFRGVVLANEVLDAMPVHRFRIGPEGLSESCVHWDGEGFAWCQGPLSDPRLEARLAGLTLPAGYESEVNLAAEEWVRSLAGYLEQGVALLIDYGFPRREYYHPQRLTGTLMCHYRHRAHHDPLILPGLQDITAHVDFTAMAEAAVEAGLQVQGFATQAAFLIGNGLLQMADVEEPRRRLELTNEVKKLTLPTEMGELFKVLALGKGFSAPLSGFALRDDRGRL